MSYLRESNINENGLAHYNTFQTSKDKQPLCKRWGWYSIQSLLQGFQDWNSSLIVKMSMVNTKTSTLELRKVQSKMTMIVKTKVTIELQFSLTPERPSSHNIPKYPRIMPWNKNLQCAICCALLVMILFVAYKSLEML